MKISNLLINILPRNKASSYPVRARLRSSPNNNTIIRIACIIAIFVFFFLIGTASASTITINSTDKFITIEGNKTFVYGVYRMCDSHPYSELPPYSSCDDQISRLSNVVFSTSVFDAASSRLAFWDANMPFFEVARIYAGVGGASSKSRIGSRKDDPYFWGYKTHPDEPSLGSTSTERAQRFSDTLNHTNKIRAFDSNHLITVGNFGYSAGGIDVTQIADILDWDPYSRRTNCNSFTTYTYGSCTYSGYHIDDFIFARERGLRIGLLKPANVVSLDEFPMPVIHVYTAGNRSQHCEGAVGGDCNLYSSSSIYHNPSAAQLRAATYWAVTAGHKGVVGWSNVLMYGSWEYNGMAANQTMQNIVNDFGGEIMSPQIQEAIISPTVAYSWNYYTPWNNKVTFSTNPTKTTFGSYLGNYLSYRLNYNSVSNKYYLIIVNKANAPVSNVDIIISNLTGTMTATTIGSTGTGSSAPGRMKTLTNGEFTDSFDGYAAHVYEISSDTVGPTITSWENDKTDNNSLEFTANTSEVIVFNATANQSVSTWNWYKDSINQNNNFDNISISWGTAGTKTIKVNATNDNGTSNTITWTINVSSDTVGPTITSWENDKTDNNSLEFTANTSEVIVFNATANQSVSTWNWYKDSINQNNNFDNISISWGTAGTKTIKVNATNDNGTSNTITWTVTVSTEWTTGIGGQLFQNKTIGNNRTCINQGDGSIGIGYLCDNFNDNNIDGWTIIGDPEGTWTINNGVLNQSGPVISYMYQNISSYENMSMFIKFKEYNNLSSYIDGADLRGNLSRINANPSWLNVQFSLGSPTQTRAHIYAYNGSSWLVVNNTATKTRYLLDWNYVAFFANGTYFRGYHSDVSYADALTTLLSSGTSSQWMNGTTIQFGAYPHTDAVISWDEIRAVELDAQGNQYLQGNYSMNYIVPSSQYAKNITINGTYPAGTNYSIKYRQNGTGDYISVGGIQTSDAIIELPIPYYRNIDILLEMNATISDTLWIDTISIDSVSTSGTWTVGSGGYAWDEYSSFDHVTDDKGDGLIKIGIFADNFNDNNVDWLTTGGTWVASDGMYKQTDATASSYSTANTSFFSNLTIITKMRSTSEGNSIYNGLGLTGRYVDANNNYRLYFYDSGDIAKINILDAGITTDLNSTAQTPPVIGTWYYYKAELVGSNLKFKFWEIGTVEPDWMVTATNSTHTSGYVGLREHRNAIEVDDFWVRSADNNGVITVGNLTTWYDAGSGYVTDGFDINVTTPDNTNYTVWYRQNATGSYVQLGSTLTGNNSLSTVTKYQNTDVQIRLVGNESATPELIAVTFKIEETPTLVYNTGYQFVIVNDTKTNLELSSIWSPTWIIGWNPVSQKWESYKPGMPYRSSRVVNKGEAIGIKISTNKSILLSHDSIFNWSLYTGYNLVGIEFRKTLSEINTSVNSDCIVEMIEYIEPETQITYTYTCSYGPEQTNASVVVNRGEGVWMNATENITQPRAW